MPDYVVDQKDKQGLVTLTGNLTATLVPALQTTLQGVLEGGVDELVFDLAKTTMLDSSGMGLLIAAANSLSRRSGRIRVINVSPDILHLLQSMRLVSRLNVSGRTE